MKLRTAHTGIVCLGILASIASGCAAERDPINRVQSGAMAKSFFVGATLRDPVDDPEFRMKAFNIGGTVGQSAYSVGEYSALDRVRWEITENLLIARKAYEIAPGADNRGTPKSEWEAKQKRGDKNLVKAPNGAVVAAYRIASHFDIKRAYNPTTGEELNVVEENSADRAWYDREFMRIDWTNNVVDGPNDPTRFFSEQFGGKATPVAYSPSDPNAEDAPHIEAESGYFDVTNKFTVEPDTLQFPWGSVRKCQIISHITGSPTDDCNAQEAVVRLSFAKVQPEEDFEPFEDTYAWHEIVGNMGGDGTSGQTSFGSAPRQGWDPQYGYTDNLTKRFKNVHELFKASHQAATCDRNEDADKNGTADQCERAVTGYAGHSGSRCDVHVGKCTLPVRDREIKSIGYWLNAEAPEALQDEVDPGTGKPSKRGTLEDLTHSWNQLLEVSLAYRREVECRATGDGDRDACHSEFFEGTGPQSKVMVSYGNWLIDRVKPQSVDKGKAVLTVCHNPVREYDPKELCGEPGTKARLGDQRKNFIVYWPFDSRAHYGGVAGVTPDPVTGEIRGASATIMGRSATYAAALQRDIIQLALGDLKMSDLIEGVPADRFVARLQSASVAAPGLVNGLSSEEMAHRASAIDVQHLRSSSGLRAITGDSAMARANETMRIAANTVVDPSAQLDSVASLDALTAKLRARAPELEKRMLDAQFTRSGAAFAGSGDTSALVAASSPLQGLDPTRIDAMRAAYQRQQGERGACFDDGMMAGGAGSVYLASLAGYFKAKYGSLSVIERGQRIYDDLWKESVKGIGLHEIGHSLGLRHNFASSWDAPNFAPQYWQLRTAEGAATAHCGDPRTGENDTCMGPRYVDPMTADEQGLGSESRPGIDYFASTSSMEYQIERFGETAGLGTYDFHAMKTLYGRVLETFDDRVMPVKEQKNLAVKNSTQLTERDYVIDGAKFLSHYTNTARKMMVFDKARDCRPATEAEKAEGAWRIVHGQVCSPAPKDHWNFDEFETGIIPGVGLDAVKWHVRDRDGKDRVRWQYRYGEEYGSGGHLHTQMGDAGADAYELVQNLARRFELTYPWTYFRRQNREYTTFALPQSTASQYFARARGIHWNVASSLGRGDVAALGDDDQLRPFAMAQADLVTFLQKAILAPEPGDYDAAPTKTIGTMKIFDIKSTSKAGLFTVGIGDGRYIGDEFDQTRGGSWDYHQYGHHAGFEVEKALAMMQFVDPRPTLFSIARENFLDERNVYVSFRSDLPTAVDQLVGGVLAEDWQSIAPAVMNPKAPALESVDLTRHTLDRSPGSHVLFPNIGFKQQLQMAIFTALFSRLGSDMTLMEKLRVWVDGDRVHKIPGARLAEFSDPRTGFVYQANRFTESSQTGAGGGSRQDRGIASRMLAHANDLTVVAFEVKRDANKQPVLDATGKPELVLDTDGHPVVVNADREGELRRYIGLIDATRQIAIILGDGPLGGGGAQD